MKKITEEFLNGTLITPDLNKELNSENWNPNPNLKGVYLKHLIKGEQSNGLFSCHLVKIESGACIKMHKHPENMELHEVLSGEGTLILDGKEYLYSPGTFGLTPAGTEHEVYAKKEIFMFAKFFPALL